MIKSIKEKPALIVVYVILWGILSAFCTTIAYAFYAFIQSPGQDFGLRPYGFSQPYYFALVLEIFVALGISFLNVQSEKKQPEGKNGGDLEDAMEAPKNSHPSRKKHLFRYFFRNFIVIIGLFGLINFGCLTEFNGKTISKTIMIPSLPVAAIMGLFVLLYIIKRTQRRKMKKKIAQQV